MKKVIIGFALVAALTTGAYAATTTSAVPTESWTVTNYYKQTVYDPKESKIGDVDDVLVDKSGKVTVHVNDRDGYYALSGLGQFTIARFMAVSAAEAGYS